MINNRQAGRRRGRNNSRPNNNGRGGGDSGNRIDSRARGNAAQLLEKYRNMARDAQMSGDRVNMEYYLQFADHYFRVLADNRSRQEEQQANRQQHRRQEGDEYFPDEMDGDVGGEDDPFAPRLAETMTRNDAPRHEAPRGEPVQDDRPERAERSERQPRERADRAERDGNEGERRPRRPRRDNVDRVVRERADEGEGQGGFDVAVLPPSIVQADNDLAPTDEAPPEAAPRRRTRRPRASAAEAAE